MNTNELHKKIKEGQTNGNISKSVTSWGEHLKKQLPKNTALSKATGMNHDISSGKSVKHKALEGAKRIGITEHRADGGKNYLAPGSGLRTKEETRSMLSGKALAQYDRQTKEIQERDKHRK